MDDKNYPQALDVLDQVIVLKPDFAEAWNKRATVHFLIEDYWRLALRHPPDAGACSRAISARSRASA